VTTNKVTQKGATAGGHIVGRDLKISNITIEQPNKPSEVLKSLYKKYKEEKENGTKPV